MHLTAFIVYTAIVTITSLLPGGQVRFESLDKVVHLLVYYIFAVLGYRALQDKRHYGLLCFVIIAYGALLEFGQSYVPGRQMSALDLAANAVGVALGAAVMSRKYSRH